METTTPPNNDLTLTKAKEKNILLESDFNKDWQPINLSKTKSKWEKIENGITQSVSVGSKKAASGTILLLKNSNPRLYELNVTAQLGTTYQTGVVFNFIDKNNFFLFYVNRYSKSYSGYWLVVAKVENGDFINLCREKYTEKINPITEFKVSGSEDGLSFFFNKKQVFFLAEQPLMEKIGLFSQQNNDAGFTNLHFFEEDRRKFFTEQEDIFEFENEDYKKNLPRPPILDKKITNTKNNNERTNNDKELILDYLKLKKPASKTQVEFTEVFSVPLDSFYNTLNDVIHASKGSGEFGFIDKTILLDQRPRRWYRELREITDDLLFFNNELERKKRSCKILESLIEEELNKDIISEQLDKYNEQYHTKNLDYRSLRHKISNIEEDKLALIREIKTNGYLIVDADEGSEMYKAGYTFQISKPTAKKRGFKPIIIEESFDLEKDSNWIKIESKLNKALFGSGAIKELSKDLYINEAKQLASFDDNLKLQEHLNTLYKQKQAVEEKISTLNSDIELNEIEKEEWLKDVNLLKSLKEEFHDFQEEHYYERDGTKSNIPNQDTLKLTDWIISKFQLQDDSDYFNTCEKYYNRNSSLINKYYQPPLKISYKDTQCSRSLHKLNRLIISNSYSVHELYKNVSWYYYNHIGIFYPDKKFVRSRSIFHDKTNLPNVGTIYKFQTTPNKLGNFSTTETLDIKAFLDYCIELCNVFVKEYEDKISQLISSKSKINTELLLLEKKTELLKTNEIKKLRKEFLSFWNNTDNKHIQDAKYEAIYPSNDPISDFLINKQEGVNNGKDFIRTYFYSPTEDGYYNQFGQSLRDFIENKNQHIQPNISLFPVLDENGNFSKEVIKAVLNPIKSITKPHLPVIKFIETYQIEIGWNGYGLGELNHTINLFPGETKELVIEKKTKITAKKEQTRKEGEETKQHITSSFEDNLQNTFSEQDKSDEKSEKKQKSDTSKSGEDASSTTSTSASSVAAEVKASANWGWGSVDASVNASKSKKNTSAESTKRAFSIAQTNEGLRASNQSKDVLKKNINNSIKKVANDTSKNNKVEFSSISSEEFQEDVSNKEIIKLENPNIGRTVNYNFFQVQNHYETSIKLIDVKIVINSGQELIEGTGIQDMRVFELEEFGKIYANSGNTDHDILVSSIIARQVLKHYANFLPGVTSGNGALHLNEGNVIDPEVVKILTYSSQQLEKITDKQELLDKLEDALEVLKTLPFSYKEKVIQEETTLPVNAGAYHMEAQVGMIPATEEYLEERRDIETEKERAELAHIKKQTQENIFYPEIPDSVSHINYNGLLNSIGSSNSTDQNNE